MTNFGNNHLGNNQEPEASFGDAPHASQDAYREFIGQNLVIACFEADMGSGTLLRGMISASRTPFDGWSLTSRLLSQSMLTCRRASRGSPRA